MTTTLYISLIGLWRCTFAVAAAVVVQLFKYIECILYAGADDATNNQMEMDGQTDGWMTAIAAATAALFTMHYDRSMKIGHLAKKFTLAVKIRLVCTLSLFIDPFVNLMWKLITNQ